MSAGQRPEVRFDTQPRLTANGAEPGFHDPNIASVNITIGVCIGTENQSTTGSPMCDFVRPKSAAFTHRIAFS
jgi:hypothetical protein